VGDLPSGAGRRRVHDVRTEWAEVGSADIEGEYREERPGVREQQALLALDPEEVQVPVVLGRAQVGEGRGSDAEQGERLRRAA